MEYNNFKKPDAGCDKYGIPRLELASYLRDNILNKLDKSYFIENGTLLGAYRNQKFIPHDDDFDYGILIDLKEEMYDLNLKISNLLTKKYQCRIIDSYCLKIEIYQPSFGKYSLLGPKYNSADYHYVTVDLQAYLKQDKSYKVLYYINPFDIIIKKNDILPLEKIKLEGEYFNCPKNIVNFLELHYGSIDPKAKYNAVSCKYELNNFF